MRRKSLAVAVLLLVGSACAFAQQKYSYDTSDGYLRFAVARWASDSGYTLRWEYSRDWRLRPDAPGDDVRSEHFAKASNLRQAISILLSSAGGAMAKRIRACIFDQERLLVIRDVRGPDCSVVSAPIYKDPAPQSSRRP